MLNVKQQEAINFISYGRILKANLSWTWAEFYQLITSLSKNFLELKFEKNLSFGKFTLGLIFSYKKY